MGTGKENSWGLEEEDLQRLSDLARSRTASFREVQRAKIILDAVSGKSLRSIARDRGLSRNTVSKTLRKILSMGPKAGLEDLFHRPGEGRISSEEKALVLSLAQNPPEGSEAGNRWTILNLTAALRDKGPSLGYPSLATIGKSTVHRILKEKGISLRSRTGLSRARKRDILLFFREFALIADDGGREGTIYSLAPLQRAVSPGSTVRRLGYSWVVGALDEGSGGGVVRLERRFGGGEFVRLLEEAASQWPGSSLSLCFSPCEPQSSPQVQSFLSAHPGRFLYDQSRHPKAVRILLESLVFAALSSRLGSLGASSWEVLSEKVREAGSDWSSLLRLV